MDLHMEERADNPVETRARATDDFLSPEGGLSREGEWLLVQLRIAESWAEHSRQREDTSEAAGDEAAVAALPARWQLTQGINLWEWQRTCAQKWLDEGWRGIAKVVTGAGKTVFAQHLIERLQTEVEPELRVAVVVPTIVLMNQWVHSVTTHSNLPPKCMGRLGGGYKDRFTHRTRILVCVINTAAAKLGQLVRETGVGEQLLLIVDECHRAAGQIMSRVFETARRYSLGLSATPEREDASDTAGGEGAAQRPDALDTIITDQLGPIIYELGVKEAVDAGILSKFEIRHYGLPLESAERMSYEKLSKDIRTLEKTLKGWAVKGAGGGATGSLFRFAQKLAGRPGGPLAKEAQQYIMNVRRRKMLLYRARARTDAVLALVADAFRNSSHSKILIFHEQISEVMRLYVALWRAGYRVTVDHSKLPDSVRADSIGLFRSDAANVLVSARALIEGFDVPSADVGIIAASSASPRQRTQTIGRMLRRPKDGTSKSAVVHALYMAGTVDEQIYDRVDWATVTGAERNAYFSWLPPSAETAPAERAPGAYLPMAQPDPPRRPRPTELEIDWSSLHDGDTYPGKFEGAEYRCDQQGNVFDAAQRPVANPKGMPEWLAAMCSGAVRFKVTPAKQAILCWDRGSNSVKFVGFLAEPFRILSAPPTKAGQRNQTKAPDQPLQFRVKQFRGRRRIQDYAGKLALLPGQATDSEKGEDARRVVEAIDELERRLGTAVHQFMIDGDKAYCIVGGQRFSICRLRKGLEFK